ncbi:TonB-dependent receptor [Gluconobacter frateurii]|uniref:TonB-dependent receptor n=1 Tax=Gluconobacter frateurii TaxID=38308 RepID=UPI001F06330D|nr:TonB-dependent receptor [Gluconobacter frateurii]UMM08254.1 TonB-dependent receptor [Gluconobacter frateurii]
MCPYRSEKQSSRKALFLVTCLAGFGSASLAAPAQAATGATAVKHKSHAHGVAAHSQKASRNAAATPVPERPKMRRPSSINSTGDEHVTVSTSRLARSRGGGMMRVETAPYAIQTITKAFIEAKSPTSTALDLIKNLPSVSVSTPDTSGMQGGTIQSRSLTDADMALMVDGAPAASASYMAEDIDSENLDSVSMMPGSSPIDLPATSAAAGVMNETSHDPSHTFGGLVDFSYGTNNLSREFIRLESGEIGNTGVRSYLSFSNSHARSWMGAGINERRHLDFGIRKDWQNGSYAKLFMSWNNEDFTIDNYPTAAEFYKYKSTGQGYGRKAGFDAIGNDYWKNNIDHWNQLFLSAPIHVVLTNKLQFDLRPYYNWGQGWDGSSGDFADGTTTYKSGQTIAAGTPLTSYFQENGALDVGATAKLGYDIDKHNHIELGYWYENQNYTQHFPVSVTKADGSNPSPNDAAYQVYSGGSRSYYGNTTGYEIHSLFLQDTAKYFHDKLQVAGGFKYVMSNVWYITYPGHSQMGQNLTAPLPHLSISYHFNEHHQVYVNAEGDFRQPSASALGNTTYTGTLPKNQYSIKEELGYRYNDKYVIVDLDLFNYNITNRLLTTYVGNNQTGVVNAGNQTARGFDAMFSTQPIYGFSPYVSFEYLNARMDSNIAASDADGNLTAYRTKGTQAPLSPHVMANFGLTYVNQGFFANATVHYTGPQSVTIAGDQRIPGYVTDTLSLGYHFKPVWYAKSPTIRLNFTNLTGSIVRTGVAGVGTNASAVRLMNGNFAAATSGAQFYVTPRFSMTGTISTAF